MDKAQAMKLMAESHRETVEELEKEINMYRKVLEFYADKENYKPFGDLMRGRIVVMIHQDGGIKAREALEME